jgi:hypothetical protein
VSRPSSRRSLQGAVLVLVLLVGLGLAGAGYTGSGPLARWLGYERQTLTPIGVQVPGEAGDPLVIGIAVRWTEQGWCIGQFSVTAVETATEVRVGQVRSELRRNGFCSGLGTILDRAWADLRLRQPLGDRRVVRASDGAVLLTR